MCLGNCLSRLPGSGKADRRRNINPAISFLSAGGITAASSLGTMNCVAFAAFHFRQRADTSNKFVSARWGAYCVAALSSCFANPRKRPTPSASSPPRYLLAAPCGPLRALQNGLLVVRAPGLHSATANHRIGFVGNQQTPVEFLPACS